VVLAKLKSGVTEAQVAAWRDAVLAVRVDGLRAASMGRDLGLRDQTLDLAAVFDFDDEPAYRRFHHDPEHERIRRELAAPLVERMERCQYRIVEA
jgi:hypothetical protein